MRYNEYMKEAWRENKDFDQSKIELLPIEWVWQWRGTNPSKMIDLDGESVDLDGLWEKIKINGILVPLIIRVGMENKKFRLETGNHMIQVLKQYGIEKVPVTVQVRDICGPEAVDVMTEATHNFDWGDEVVISERTSEYMKPSEVFRSFSV